MSIPVTESTTVSHAAAPPEGGMRESIVKVVNALTGSQLNAAEANNVNLSEDILFAAIVHDRLSVRSPELAEKLLLRLPKLHDKKLANKKRQPVFRSVDTVLKQAISKGQITRQEKRTLMQEAFGKAQIDRRPSTLRRKPVNFVGKHGLEDTTNIDAFAERVSENTAANRSDLHSFRKRLLERSRLTPKQVKRNRALLQQIQSKVAESTAPPDSGSKIHNTNPPDHNDLKTESNELLFNPKDKNDHASVYIPEPIAKTTFGVVLYSPETNEKLELDFYANLMDGRSVFRSPGTDVELPDGPLQIYLKNSEGDWSSIDIDSSKNFYREEFSE